MSMAVMEKRLVVRRADTMAVPRKPQPPVTRTLVCSISRFLLIDCLGLMSERWRCRCGSSGSARLHDDSFSFAARTCCLLLLITGTFKCNGDSFCIELRE
jgi:hypothetical protein